MQQCGFSTSAAAHDGVCAARLKFGGNAVQDLRVRRVAEGDVLKSDAVLQPGQLDGASAACSRFPVRMDAASGRSISPAATAVSSGEYHSIMPSAPRNVTSFVMTESCWERKSVSMLPASLVSAER